MKALLLIFALLGSMQVANAQARQQSRPAPPPAPKPLPTVNKVAPYFPPDTGATLVGATYTNPFLGFMLTFPDGWEVQNADVIKRANEYADRVVQEATSDDPQQTQRAIQQSMARTTHLLFAIKRSAVTNAVFQSATEDLTSAIVIPTARQYAESARRTINAIEGPMVFGDTVTTERIGSEEYAVIKARPRTPPPLAPDMEQLYYITIRKRHAVTFIITFSTPEERQACINALNAIKFQ